MLLGATSGLVYAHDPGLGLVRYNPDGSLDGAFGQAGIVAERTPRGGLDAEALAIQPNGTLLLAGTTSDLATASVGFGLARYTADGHLDTNFGAGGRVITPVGAAEAAGHALGIRPDGRILVAGSGFGEAGGPSAFAVARYTPDGTLDRSFGPAGNGTVLTPIGSSGAEARALALEPDGRIVLAGTTFATAEHDDAFAVVRYTPDGVPDPRFGPAGDGTVVTPFSTADGEASPARAMAMVIQSDGRIVVGGSVGGHQGTFGLARYTPDGTLDRSFATGGTLTATLPSRAQADALASLPDGRLLVAGGLGNTDNLAFVVARLTAQGSFDRGFGSGGLVTTSFDGGGSGAHALAVQSDGRIVAAGSGNGDFAIARYLPDGQPDPTFGTAGRVITHVSDAGSFPAALGLEPDGKLVTTGLTYFYVPPPGSDPPWPLIGAAAATVVVATALGGLWVVRRRPRRASPTV